MDLHFGRDEFQGRSELLAALARRRGKDTTLDHGAGGRADRLEAAARLTAATMEAERRLRPGQEQEQRFTDRLEAATRAAAAGLRAERERDSGRGR